MHTRREYLNQTCSYQDYYGQYATWFIADALRSAFGIVLLEAAFYEDRNFNTIPLAEWDAIDLRRAVGRGLVDAGDFWTLAGNVCILKEVARQMIELELRGWDNAVGVTLPRSREPED